MASPQPLHIKGLDVIGVCLWRTTTTQGSSPDDQAALFKDTLPAQNIGRPLFQHPPDNKEENTEAQACYCLMDCKDATQQTRKAPSSGGTQA